MVIIYLDLRPSIILHYSKYFKQYFIVNDLNYLVIDFKINSTFIVYPKLVTAEYSIKP